MKLIIPENYDPVLDLRQTQEAIKYIRDTFQMVSKCMKVYIQI